MALSLNQQRLIRLGEAIFPGEYGSKPAWRGYVARQLGVDVSLVNRWASGEREPSDERIEQLERVMEERVKAQLKVLGRERARKIMEVCR